MSFDVEGRGDAGESGSLRNVSDLLGFHCHECFGTRTLCPRIIRERLIEATGGAVEGDPLWIVEGDCR